MQKNEFKLRETKYLKEIEELKRVIEEDHQNYENKIMKLEMEKKESEFVISQIKNEYIRNKNDF